MALRTGYLLRSPSRRTPSKVDDYTRSFSPAATAGRAHTDITTAAAVVQRLHQMIDANRPGTAGLLEWARAVDYGILATHARAARGRAQGNAADGITVEEFIGAVAVCSAP
jgi:hypothetical protein